MFCAGRVPDEDLQRTMKACGGSIQSTVHDLNDETLGNKIRSVCKYIPLRLHIYIVTHEHFWPQVTHHKKANNFIYDYVYMLLKI